MFGREIRMRLDEGAAVGEGGAIAGVEIGFRRQTLGEDYVVSVEFDMPIFDTVLVDLGDGAAVDQTTDRHQHALGCDIVAGRKPEIAPRRALAEGARANPHRPHRRRIGMAGDFDAPLADPDNRPRRAGGGDGEIADAQILDRDLAARCGSACRRSNRAGHPGAGGRRPRQAVGVGDGPVHGRL